MTGNDPLWFRASVASWMEGVLGGPCTVAAGLPVRALPETIARCPTDVWLGLEQALAPQRPLWLGLDATLALAVVERSLGGEGHGPPGGHPAAALQQAELGVLAYAVARALADLGGHLRLTELGRAPRPDEAALADLLLWPLRLTWPGGAAAVRALVPKAHWLPRAAAHWVLAAEPGSLQGLQAGDVMLLDGTSAGRDGWLRAEGFEGFVAVRREVEAFGLRSGPEPDPRHVRVELGLGPVDLAEFADLKEDSQQRMQVRLATGRARLIGAGQPEYEGELVRLQGRLGVRIISPTPHP